METRAPTAMRHRPDGDGTARAATPGMARTSTATRTRGKSKAAARRGHKGGETAKRRHVGIMKPVQPDDALADVVGRGAQPRPELTRRLWGYIKSHQLQDPSDGRVIRPDPTLRRVVGNQRRVSMFDLARHLNQHLR
jgi:chromatin remodeling complex protein RSC6